MSRGSFMDPGLDVVEHTFSVSVALIGGDRQVQHACGPENHARVQPPNPGEAPLPRNEKRPDRKPFGEVESRVKNAPYANTTSPDAGRAGLFRLLRSFGLSIRRRRAHVQSHEQRVAILTPRPQQGSVVLAYGASSRGISTSPKACGAAFSLRW